MFLSVICDPLKFRSGFIECSLYSTFNTINIKQYEYIGICWENINGIISSFAFNENGNANKIRKSAQKKRHGPQRASAMPDISH